jgi:hypothetical protein
MVTQLPNGFDEINKIYGALTPDFEQEHIVSLSLPYPLLYDNHTVHSIRVHQFTAENFLQLFNDILAAGLTDKVKNYGGAYNFRQKRGVPHPSSHCWGIAIDLEPDVYPLGSTNRWPDTVTAIFERAGFACGQDFHHRRDPMHIQLCTGY